MPLDIEQYALIGNTRTAALVGGDGSIDWLCLPRFDADACFAALLGTPEHGRWLIRPKGNVHSIKRRYRKDTLVLETEYATDAGTVCVTDCMPHWKGRSDVVRVVRGISGRVDMEMDLAIRFDYGRTVPWVRQVNGVLDATAGPHSLQLHTPIETRGENFRTVAEFSIGPDVVAPFTLSYFPSRRPTPLPIDPLAAVAGTTGWWREWVSHIKHKGPWRDQVVRSLITLKALTYAPTGGIVAAPTTSLPEWLGGERNWDYRFCWLRDSALTLDVLLKAGCYAEAQEWTSWLLRAAAGRPEDLQILYGLSGERYLPETEIAELPGYRDSRPVRIGNAAADQMQIDVYGEVMDMLHIARSHGIDPKAYAWHLQCKLLGHLEKIWDQPDHGIWEIRGEPRHFTHSRVMAWVAVDRAIKAVEQFEMEGPVEDWRRWRDAIHKDVCDKGFDKERNAFVQYYGGKGLDASLLLIPLVGFLPPDDPRVRGTVEAIERGLMRHGLVTRYDTSAGVDGLPGAEGVFLPCSFWLVNDYALLGRMDDARKLFERLLSHCNDIGLISEECDPESGALLGNFPQAFTHLALINAAVALTDAGA
ncbi:MAG: glycoside hydrolase family 15 protein [Rhodanobacteraceae bacterium]